MSRLGYALLVAAALLLLLDRPAPPSSGPDLPLCNPGFEASGPGNLPAAWELGYCHGPVRICRDATTAHSGRASLRITHGGAAGGDARQPVGQAGLFPGDPRRVSPGDRLHLSAWYRTSGLECSGSKPLAYVALVVDGLPLAKVEAEPGAGDWRHVEATTQIHRSLAASGRGHIEARMWDYTGTIWWDDVRLTRLPAQPLDPQRSAVHLGRQEGEATVTLADEHLSLAFDRRTGALLGLRSPATGTALLVPEAEPAVPVRLSYLSDKPRRLAPALTECVSESRNGRPGLRFEYEVRDACIRLILRVALTGEGRSEWTVEVRNDSDLTIIGVAWPVLNGLRVGPEGSDDCLAHPWRGGKLLRAPGSQLRIRPSAYVGLSSMGWLDLYDEPLREAVYVGSHDPEFLDVCMNVTPRGAGGALCLEFEKRAYIPPGSEWRSAAMAVAAHRGDWHEGAKIYREWAKKVIKPATPPGWLRESFCWDTGEFMPQYWRYEHIPALWNRAAERGFSAVAYHGQMVLNDCCRFYYPDPFLGTPEELTQRTREVARRGGRMLYYTNAIGWLRHYPERLPPKYDGLIPAELKPTWQQMAPLVARRLDGGEVIQYEDEEGDNDNLIMCPAAREWQRHMRFWVADKYVREYGVAGMMVDQAGALPAQSCFDFSHGHAHHGCWGAGLGQLLRGIYEAAHAARPDVCIYIEGRSDYLSQWADTCMFGNWGNLPEMLPYTFPEILVGYDRADLDDSFLLGGVWQWGARYPNARVDAIGKVFHAVGDILGYARFVDTDGLGALPQGVRAKAFVDEGRGAVLINLSDARKAPEPFRLTVSRDLYRGGQVIAYYYPEQLGGQRTRIQGRMVGGEVRVDVPGLPNGGEPKVAAIILTPTELPVLEISAPAEVDRYEPFAVTVTCGGRPVSGATLHIGDRAYTTEQDGAVGEAFGGEDPDGVWLLRAKKQGYLSARATMRLSGPSLEMVKVLP